MATKTSVTPRVNRASSTRGRAAPAMAFSFNSTMSAAYRIRSIADLQKSKPGTILKEGPFMALRSRDHSCQCALRYRRPHERLRVVVVRVEERVDGHLQGANAAEAAVPLA